MSITVQTPGAVATPAATSISVAYPASIAAGDLLLLVTVAKYSAFTSNPPSGFTRLNDDYVAGSGGTGTDVGNTRTTVWYRIATGSESGSITVTKATETGSVLQGQCHRFSRSAGHGWNILYTTGASNTGAASWSAAGANNVYLDNGDVLLAFSGANTDGAAFSSHAFSASGATFDTVVEATDNGTTTGHDTRLVTAYAPVTGGPSTAAPSYTATGSAGTPEGGTVFVRIREAPGVTAEQGTHTLTGQAATLTVGYKLSAAQGSIGLSGQSAQLYGGAPRAWSSTSWWSTAWYAGSWFGQGSVDYPLTAEQGDYDLTGQAAGLLAGRKLTPVELGNITLTGQDAALQKGFTLSAEQGGYALSGQAATFPRTYQVTATQGSYTLTGYDVVFPLGSTVGRSWFQTAWYEGAWYEASWALNTEAPNHYSMPAESGSYALSFISTGRAWAVGSWAENSWYGTAWNVQSGGVARNLVFSVDTGYYTYTGDDALRDMLFRAEQGTHVQNGQDAALRFGYKLSADTGYYYQWSNDTGLNRGWRMPAQFGAYSTYGPDVEFVVGVGEYAAPGYYTATWQEAAFSRGYLLSAEQGTHTLTGQSANLNFGDIMQADSGTYALSGQDATLAVARKLTAETGYYSLTGLERWVVPSEASAGAGKSRKPSRRRRKPVLVEIDGETFVVSSEAEAVELVEKAKEVAREKAEKEAADIVAKREKKARKAQLNTAPLRLTEPSIDVRPLNDGTIDQKWINDVAEKMQAVMDSYRQVAEKHEMALLLKVKQELDEEDELVALLLTM